MLFFFSLSRGFVGQNCVQRLNNSNLLLLHINTNLVLYKIFDTYYKYENIFWNVKSYNNEIWIAAAIQKHKQRKNLIQEKDTPHEIDSIVHSFKSEDSTWWMLFISNLSIGVKIHFISLLYKYYSCIVMKPCYLKFSSAV